MPPIVTILALLALGILAVLFVTSRNPTTLTPEQQSKYARILRILVGIVLIGSAIRYFFF